MAADTPKGKHGGARPGAGRPKSAKTRCQELALCEALIWHRSPEIVNAMIEFALNGDASLLKYLGDRFFGRIEDYTPIADRLEEIRAALPDGFNPEAMLAALHEKLMGGTDPGEWTKAEADRVGRLGVQTLERLAGRGDKQAAAILARQHLPDPMLSLPERAETMTPEELRDTMTRRYAAAWPWLPQSEIERMVGAVCRGRAESEGSDGR